MANFNFNRAILGGRLTDSPEMKTTNGGTMYCDFTIAISRPRNKNGDAETDYIRCTAWKQKAELICNYFRKGSSICVIGPIQTRTWTDQQGNKRKETEISVNEVWFVDSKSEEPGAEAPPAPQFTAENAPKFEDITDDEDLPF